MTEQAVSEKAEVAAERAIEDLYDRQGGIADAEALAQVAAQAALPELEAGWRKRLARWARQKAAEGRSREEPHVHVGHWEKLADAVLSLDALRAGDEGWDLLNEECQRSRFYREALEQLQLGPDTLTPDGLRIVLAALYPEPQSGQPGDQG